MRLGVLVRCDGAGLPRTLSRVRGGGEENDGARNHDIALVRSLVQVKPPRDAVLSRYSAFLFESIDGENVRL